MRKHSLDINVTGYTKKGNGLGSFTCDAETTQRFVELPFTAIGDRVRCEVGKKRKGRYQGRLLELLTPSEQRVTPRCSHFGSCGGCRWQHISYSDQLKQKEEFVRRCLIPYSSEKTLFFPIIPCNNPWEYRNKMEFSFSQNRAGEKFLGLVLAGGKGRAFNLQECHLVPPWFSEVLRAVRKWWQGSSLTAYHPASNSGALRTLTLREGLRTADRLAMLTVSGRADFALSEKELNGFVEVIRTVAIPKNEAAKLSIFLRIQQTAKGQPTQFVEIDLGGPQQLRESLHITSGSEGIPQPKHFQIGPTAFFQPNSSQAEKLYSVALHLSNVGPNSVVYDLYSGTGAIAVTFAPFVKMVVAMELSSEAVVNARKNAALNNIDNMIVLEGDVPMLLKQLKGDNDVPAPDIAIIDPPRGGLEPKGVEQLLALKAPTLLYISCNPETQAANLAHLIEGGYRLVKVQPVDQFPHTAHIENIALLKI